MGKALSGAAMQVIDAHCHFWRLSRGDYGWLAGEGGPLAPIRRDFLPADYPDERAATRLIVVQAAPTLAETDFLLALASRQPRIAGVVGWVDLAAPEAVGQLRHRAANPHFKGVRPMLQDIADSDWLERRARPDALAALQDLGLRLDALVTARHLPMLARFARAHDGLPLVIDHAAKPQPANPQPANPQPGLPEDWVAGMRDLAAIPHLHCKLSGLLTEFSATELRDPLPVLRDILDRLLGWFGAGRLIWGSDWPVLTLAAPYGDWRALSDALLAGLAPAERDAILRGNAARFYGVTAGVGA